jgi:hypothetical protein
MWSVPSSSQLSKSARQGRISQSVEDRCPWPGCDHHIVADSVGKLRTALSKHLNGVHKGKFHEGSVVESLYERELYYCKSVKMWVSPNQAHTHKLSHNTCDRFVLRPRVDSNDLGRVVQRDSDDMQPRPSSLAALPVAAPPRQVEVALPAPARHRSTGPSPHDRLS